MQTSDISFLVYKKYENEQEEGARRLTVDAPVW